MRCDEQECKTGNKPTTKKKRKEKEEEEDEEREKGKLVSNTSVVLEMGREVVIQNLHKHC